jgi:hypothetical protein
VTSSRAAIIFLRLDMENPAIATLSYRNSFV